MKRQWEMLQVPLNEYNLTINMKPIKTKLTDLVKVTQFIKKEAKPVCGASMKELSSCELMIVHQHIGQPEVRSTLTF